MIAWPDNLRPIRQSFYLRETTIRFANSQGGFQVAERAGRRWVADIDFRLSDIQAAQMDAFLASLRGPAGKVLLPNFMRMATRLVPQSMDDYAARVGATFFDDNHDFTDQLLFYGDLATEESVPLGMEVDSLFGENFDLLLVFPCDLQLVTEDYAEMLAENILVPFALEDGRLFSFGSAEPLEIGIEDGMELGCEDGTEILATRGGGFFEGVGQPSLNNGADSTLVISGCAPWTNNIAKSGETIAASSQRLHIVIADSVTDIDGRASIAIAPSLREVVTLGTLVLGGGAVLMRVIGDDAGKNETLPPGISTYRLTFEEVLSS